MPRSRLHVVLLALIAGGCATVTTNLPAVTDAPTGNHYEGRVIWHDLLTNTPAESRKFYAELFGWEFEKPGLDLGFGDESSYMLIRHDGQLIGGMVDANVLNDEENISQWITMMSITDINAAVDSVVAAGGEILTQPTDVGSRGVLAVVAGPDRAIFAMIQTRDGDPAETEPVMNRWLWDELWTNDVQQTTDFYQQVAGFQIEDHEVGDTDRTFRVLKTDDEPRVAVLSNPFENEQPVWVNYIRVADPAAITARVEDLGGRIILEAQPRAIGGQVAFIAGPSGAGVLLQTWPLDQEGDDNE